MQIQVKSAFHQYCIKQIISAFHVPYTVIEDDPETVNLWVVGVKVSLFCANRSMPNATTLIHLFI
jgi:hypothetical protein